MITTRNRCLLTREEIEEKVKGGESFSEVARAAGVSRERIRQIWMKEFAESQPWEMQNGKRLGKHLWTPKRREKTRERRAEERDSLVRVKRICEKEGLKFEIIPTGCSLNFPMIQMVKIEGRFCNLHILKKALPVDPQYPERVYWRLRISRQMLKKADFVIVMIEGKEIEFIFSSAILVANYMGTRNFATVNIPIAPSTGYHNTWPRVKHWDYKGAWGLLKKGEL